tara:strand:- start:4975 stop:5799 length:825 start_codon:yes stop_codon:yes gene_type:complete
VITGAAHRELQPNFRGEPIYSVGAVILSGIVLTIIQDYLFTVRHNTSFVFYESLLFKCVWVVFGLAYMFSNKYFYKIEGMNNQKLVLLLGTLIASHTCITSVMVWWISWIFKEQGYGIAKIIAFTLSNDSAKILLVYLLSILFIKKSYAQKAKQDESKAIRLRSKTQVKSLQINNGKQCNLVNFESIYCIKADSPYVIVHTSDNSFLHTSSLKKLAEKLDSRFVKIHRSCIVNMDKVTSYKSRLNGDYDVSLSGDIQVRLSRNYAKEFKEVIEG